jgi:DNA-binding MarR family transcriptional regulator
MYELQRKPVSDSGNESERSAARDQENLTSLTKEILEIDEKLYSDFGVSLLSNEFRTIFQIVQRPSLMVKDATLSSRLSSRAFHNLLKLLEARSIISLRKNGGDGRAKYVTLSTDAISLLTALFVNIGIS